MHNGLSITKVCGLSLNYNIALEVSQGGFERFCLDLETKDQGFNHIRTAHGFARLAESLLRKDLLKRLLLRSASNWVN